MELKSIERNYSNGAVGRNHVNEVSKTFKNSINLTSTKVSTLIVTAFIVLISYLTFNDYVSQDLVQEAYKFKVIGLCSLSVFFMIILHEVCKVMLYEEK